MEVGIPIHADRRKPSSRETLCSAPVHDAIVFFNAAELDGNATALQSTALNRSVSVRPNTRTEPLCRISLSHGIWNITCLWIDPAAMEVPPSGASRFTHVCEFSQEAAPLGSLLLDTTGAFMPPLLTHRLTGAQGM